MYRLSRIGKGSRKGIGREVKEARTTTKLSPDHVTRSDDDFSFLRFSLSFSALRSKKFFLLSFLSPRLHGHWIRQCRKEDISIHRQNFFSLLHISAPLYLNGRSGRFRDCLFRLIIFLLLAIVSTSRMCFIRSCVAISSDSFDGGNIYIKSKGW